MGFLNFLSPADVILDVSPANTAGLLELLATEAATRAGRSPDELLEALKAREHIGSTALGKGVALPHAEIHGLVSPVILFARLGRPIMFDDQGDEPIDLAFAVLWPAAQRKDLLIVMAEICRSLRDPQSLRRLRAATTPADVIQILREAVEAAGQTEIPDEG